LRRNYANLLLWRGDFRAAVSAPGAQSAIKETGTAALASAHELVAQKALAHAVIGLQPAYATARLYVGAHLHHSGAFAQELGLA